MDEVRFMLAFELCKMHDCVICGGLMAGDRRQLLCIFVQTQFICMKIQFNFDFCSLFYNVFRMLYFHLKCPGL